MTTRTSRTSCSPAPSEQRLWTTRSTRCRARRCRRSCCSTTSGSSTRSERPHRRTWDDLMDLVPVFNDAGVAPISLAGQSRWTNMMWLEFLYDRIGGPDVWDAIFNGESDAWSDPAALEASTKVQDLVKANGFINGF